MQMKQIRARVRVSFNTVPLAIAAAAFTTCAFVAPAGLRLGRGLRTASAVGKSAVALHAGADWDQLVRSGPGSQYRLRIGRAIDVLRNDVAMLFDEGPFNPDLSIFSEDVEVVDARLPSFRLQGIDQYRKILETLKWSVRAACSRSKLEITSLTQPINNQIYMRWKLKLWPIDVFSSATSLLGPAFGAGSPLSIGMPFIVEGYTRYEFDSWSADIIRLTLDITNPPMYITDLLRQYSQPHVWMTPVATPAGMPTMPTVMRHDLGDSSPPSGAGPAPSDGSIFTGATSAPQRVEREKAALSAGSWLSLPQTCEDDFECNDGKANFPLQCCDVPLLGKFCCEPDDFTPEPRSPAYVPLPVPVEDDLRYGRSGKSM